MTTKTAGRSAQETQADRATPPRTKTSWWIWATVIRLLTALCAYILIAVTVMYIIPLLGMFLYSQAGLNQVDANADGTIVVWLAPFAFVVIMLAALEIFMIRWMWTLGSKKIAAMKAETIAALPSRDATAAKKKTAPAKGKE